MSFAVSACFHGGVLAWVALGAGAPAKWTRPLNDREIRPSEKKIVWYRSARHCRISPRRRARLVASAGEVAADHGGGVQDEEKPRRDLGAGSPGSRSGPAAERTQRRRRECYAFVPPPEGSRRRSPKLPEAPRVEATADQTAALEWRL
jgi:hypothetical protein